MFALFLIECEDFPRQVARRRNTNRAEMLTSAQLKKISSHQDKTLQPVELLKKMRLSMGNQAADAVRLEAAQKNVLSDIKSKEKEALAKAMGLSVDDLESEEDVDAEDDVDDEEDEGGEEE